MQKLYILTKWSLLISIIHGITSPFSKYESISISFTCHTPHTKSASCILHYTVHFDFFCWATLPVTFSMRSYTPVHTFIAIFQLAGL